MSKQCIEIQREVAWLLSEGAAGDGAALVSHLKECPRCRRDEEKLRALLSTLGGRDVPEPGEAYWQSFLPRLRNRIGLEQSAGASRRPGSFWLGALAASVASFMLAALVVGRWSTPPEVRVRARFQEMARQSTPDPLPSSQEGSLSRAENLPGSEGDDAQFLTSNMEKVLEETFPEDDSDVFSAASELGKEQRQHLEKTLSLDWV
jgi:hypothetical protein